MINHLATGEFGSVAKAYWRSKSGRTEVAVKSVPPNASSTERVKLLQEAAMMGQFRHPNVAQLQGIVTNGMPVSLRHDYMTTEASLCLPALIHCASICCSGGVCCCHQLP